MTPEQTLSSQPSAIDLLPHLADEAQLRAFFEGEDTLHYVAATVGVMPYKEDRAKLRVDRMWEDPVEFDEYANQVVEQAYMHDAYLDLLLEAHNLEVALGKAAAQDWLTGLLSKGGMTKKIEEAIAEVEEGDHLALLLLDLDAFKAFNDIHGHAAGDKLLVAVGAELKRQSRASDFATRLEGVERIFEFLAGRIGGDEYAVLLRWPKVVKKQETPAESESTESTPEEAEKAKQAAEERRLQSLPPQARAEAYAERIIGELNTFLAQYGMERLKAAGGVAVWEPGMLPFELFRTADRAMFVAKRAGKRGYIESMNLERREHLAQAMFHIVEAGFSFDPRFIGLDDEILRGLDLPAPSLMRALHAILKMRKQIKNK